MNLNYNREIKNIFFKWLKREGCKVGTLLSCWFGRDLIKASPI